jgi:acyl-CoA dehydrogenase
MNDQQISKLERIMEEQASEFRSIGLAVDRDKEKIRDFLDLEGVKTLSSLMIPEEYNHNSLTIDNQYKVYGIKVLERVIALEKLAYGDVGVLLGAPGPSLSGQVIYDMGDRLQQEKYYTTLTSSPKWTFFALTEPQKGSDASDISSTLLKDGSIYILNGEKKYIGNGARAELGVIFLKTGEGPLGLRSVFIETSKEGFSAEPLETLGVKGAELSHIKIENVEISDAELLAKHLKPTRRGLWGAIQTFNKMRPGVAALGLGIAQATMDYTMEHRNNFTIEQKHTLEKFKDEIISVRNLIREAAREVDNDPASGYSSSMAKIKAVQLAEKITEYSLYLFGPHALLEHPYLNKWFRDARAFEFMEGTSNIQRLNLFQNFNNGKIASVR